MRNNRANQLHALFASAKIMVFLDWCRLIHFFCLKRSGCYEEQCKDPIFVFFKIGKNRKFKV